MLPPTEELPFLHICLQSGCDAAFARMGECIGQNFIVRLLRKHVQVLPTIALGTDLIVGFPGETDKDLMVMSFVVRWAF